jgi:hypothetical protein
MSYNGTGTFNINTAGQPVVTGTTITSTAFNLLTTDLATGLTTALTKDGQTTPTANIPLGGFKITGLGAGVVATDAVQYAQLQANATTIATVTGTDTLVGSLTPALTAYATGNLFSFVAVNTNTGATTININSLGAKSITKSGTTALVAGDIVSGQVYLIEYDGTRFQLFNPSSAIQVYPGAGIANSTGSAWGTSYTTTGSGTVVALATSPTFVTPILGTPTSGNLSTCTADGTNLVGYRNIPQVGSAKTASYTLVASDVGKFVVLGTSGLVVVPASVFAVGDAISVFNNTTAAITCTSSAITAYLGGTNTVVTSFSLATRGVCTILFVTTSVVVITGNVS